MATGIIHTDQVNITTYPDDPAFPVKTSDWNNNHTINGDVDFASHKAINVTDPTNPQDAATKNYVDLTAQGVQWKAPVRVATVANGTLSTAFANGQTVDGVILATGDRILLKNQTSQIDNGIYTVNASGAPTRSSDAATGAEIKGSTVFATEGTVNADAAFINTNTGTITIGTTNITYVQFTGAAEIIAGNGLAKSANTLSIDTSITADLPSAQTFAGVKTFSGGITMSGSNISLGANIINTTNFSMYDSSGFLTMKGTGAGTMELGLYSSIASPSGIQFLSSLVSLGNSITGILRNFASIVTIQNDPTNAAEYGELRLQVIENGVPNTNYLICSATASTKQIQALRNFNIGSNSIITTSYTLKEATTVNTSLFLQPTATNSLSLFAIAPTGTSNIAFHRIFRTSDITTNYENMKTGSDLLFSGEFVTQIEAAGTGSLRPWNIYMGTTKLMSFNTANTVTVYAPTTISGIGGGGLLSLSSTSGNCLVSFSTPLGSNDVDVRIVTSGTDTWSIYGSRSSRQLQIGNFGNTALQFDINGNVILGNAGALATNASNGFSYMPSGAGPPTGTPTAVTGKVPFYYDSTNNKLYLYNGGWKGVTLS